GRTLKTILYKLEHELQYKVNWKVFDSIDFALPQSRKRIFIVGTKLEKPMLDGLDPKYDILGSILESGLETLKSDFTDKILSHFELKDLYGKSIKDKRGGDNNIHSWDIGLKGEVTKDQSILLESIFKQRRSKKWALEIGVEWMDGMPLTLNQIKTFTNVKEDKLNSMLTDLTAKGYLKLEYPLQVHKLIY
ncbi:MAG: DNA (cytosine-5-)-methyltransferase, partial [Pedobacter sp.]